MNYKVLYRKYRPQEFDSVIGQEYTTKLLKNAVMDNKISHAYIFTGPRGTGKTSTARIFAKAINCEHPINGNPCNECSQCLNFNENPDIIEIDAASNNGVDDVRELINNIRLAPTNSKYKVYIIDEFHMLSTSAFNALLLTLEEPPANIVFILATTDIQNVPITILSRCQRFDFKLMTTENIIKRLDYVCQNEKIKITPEALGEIAYLSSGGMRDALSILDQVSSFDNEITENDVSEMFGSVSINKIQDLIVALDQGNVENLLNKIADLKSNGVNSNIVITKLIAELKENLILIRKNKYEGNMLFDDIYNLIYDLNRCLIDIKNVLDPYGFIEITLLKYIHQNSNEINNKIIKNETNNNVITVENSSSASDIVETTKTISIVKIDTNVRINNCFVNANKDYLLKIKNKWADFIIYEANANKKILSYIADTDVVLSSDEYGVITNKMDSTVDLLNENISSIESDFKNFYGYGCKFVAITNILWEKEKEKYKNNIKNHYKYSIMNETSLINNTKNQDSNNDLEQLATEIFGNNVEVK